MIMAVSSEEREKLKEELKEELLLEIKAEKDLELKRELELKLQSELKTREEYLIQETERKKVLDELKSKEEPWVDIRGVVEDTKNGIKIELDWNDAFIKYLKTSGLDGPSDDIIVQRWLEMISMEISTDLALFEDKYLRDSSEFE